MSIREELSATLDENTQQLAAYLRDLDEPQLIAQLPGGGQHALWIASHILAIEDLALNKWVLNRDPSLPEWWRLAALFGTTPKSDPSAYPTRPALLEELSRVRAATLEAMASIPEEQWDRATPEGAPPFLRTVRAVFTRLPCHAFYHTGQFACVRRMLGKKPMRM